VELWFLNWLRPRLPRVREVQILARIGAWFIRDRTGRGNGPHRIAFDGLRPVIWPACIGGLAFVGIELIAHFVLQLRGRPSFYNGRG